MVDLSMTHLSKEKHPLVSLLQTEAGNSLRSGTSICPGDTTLRLNCSSYETNRAGRAECSLREHDISAPDDGCRLVLGLGPTPTFTSGYCISRGVNRVKESATSTKQSWSLENGCNVLQLGLSSANVDEMISAENNPSLPTLTSMQIYSKEHHHLIPVIDEKSTSAKRNPGGGCMPTLLFAPQLISYSGMTDVSGSTDLYNIRVDAFTNKHQFQDKLQQTTEHLSAADSSFGDFSANHSVSRRTTTHPKKCTLKGCPKGARGASGLCIGHGGGRRCQKPGCNRGAESRTALCKAHGGGRRCQTLGCTKSAEGKTDFCIAHGGGRRCRNPGCCKAARGKSGLCIKHGGGRRCTVEGCTKSAEGQPGLCISHGGGRRCRYPNCHKGAQGSTMYCKAHGGGRRCIFQGCTKGAEGSIPLCKGHGGGKRCLFGGGGICPKSVHGGTQCCVAHGGGKRCAAPGCTKSARGRTDCCVKHGGGKRCHFEGCDKSAQGRTNFCKAHGGGKRCEWASGCGKFARGRSGLCAAHGAMMAAQQEGGAGKTGGGLIGAGLFQGLVTSSITVESWMDNGRTSASLSSALDCVESQSSSRGKQLHIPPQVLVPLSMKSPSLVSFGFGDGGGDEQEKSFEFAVRDGRVHGGNLLPLLGGWFKNAVDPGLV